MRPLDLLGNQSAESTASRSPGRHLTARRRVSAALILVTTRTCRIRKSCDVTCGSTHCCSSQRVGALQALTPTCVCSAPSSLSTQGFAATNGSWWLQMRSTLPSPGIAHIPSGSRVSVCTSAGGDQSTGCSSVTAMPPPACRMLSVRSCHSGQICEPINAVARVSGVDRPCQFRANLWKSSCPTKIQVIRESRGARVAGSVPTPRRCYIHNGHGQKQQKYC